MQTILDAPVLADGPIHSLCVGSQAAEIEAVLHGGFSLDGPLTTDPRKRLQVLPTFRREHAVEWVEDVTASHFQPATVFLDDFVHLMRRLAGRGVKAADEIPDGLRQGGLMVFDRQNLVGSPIVNGLSKVGLRAHGVDRDDTAFQGQGRQQFGKGGLFVRFRGRRTLSQYQAHLGSKRADPGQRRGARFP